MSAVFFASLMVEASLGVTLVWPMKWLDSWTTSWLGGSMTYVFEKFDSISWLMGVESNVKRGCLAGAAGVAAWLVSWISG